MNLPWNGTMWASFPTSGDRIISSYTFIVRKQQIGSYKVRIPHMRNDVVIVPYLTKTELLCGFLPDEDGTLVRFPA